MVTVVVQGIMAQQAATGVAAGGVGGTRIGVPRAGEYDEVTGEPVVGGNRRPRPIFPPLDWPHSTSNVDTNRYSDNKNDDKQNCKMFPYKEREEKCKGKNAHHAIPDHCWRMGNAIYLALGRAMAGPFSSTVIGDKAAQEFEESMSNKGKYYYSNMDKEEGLAICVEGKGKTLVHGAIHLAFDKAEYALGLHGNPQWTATLGDLEEQAAIAIAAETGCDKNDLQKQLRDYHNSKGLDKDTTLRADPFGKNTTSKTDFQIDPVIKSRMPTKISTGE